MRIEVKTASEELWVSFEESDFFLKDSSGQLIWIEVKEAIKDRLPYPQAHWDGENKVWIIKDDEKGNARRGIQAIHKRYFGDENQSELF